MLASKPTYVNCDGGLDLDTDKFTLMNRPNVARILKNFEVSTGGGYRRINGYTKWGGVSATRPSGAADAILGVHVYALGVVVAVSDDVYYSEDGITWIQINKDTTASGLVQASLGAASTLARTDAGRTRMVHIPAEEDHVSNPYGVLYIASDGGDPVAKFWITGTGGTRTFHYVELATPSAGALLENHDHHLCIVDTTNAPSTIYYSDTNDHDDFIGAGSGSITLSDKIVAIKSFRKKLFIFCEDSIHQLNDINDASNIAIQEVTGKLGCIAGDSVQELGGDLIFLGPDGFRNIGGTSRIEDVDLSALSNPIQPLTENIAEGISAYSVTSTVIREKSQYRMFYLDSSGNGGGFCGVLKRNEQGGVSMQWSELTGLPVNCINSYYDADGEEIIYHGGDNGYVYLHDSGNSFDGSNIIAIYKTPDMHLGDLGLRKTMHYMNISIENEGAASISVDVNFDFGSTRITQPSPFTVSISGGGARYGTAVYGVSTYGIADSPLERIPLQGSGHSVSYTFSSTDSNPPYTIHGFHTEVFPSGRK